MRKLRFRKVKKLPQDHITQLWESRNVNLYLTSKLAVWGNAQSKEQYSEFLSPILIIKLYLMVFMISDGEKGEW